ncbi:MAG: hypothetical protein M1319_02200 [Chloroflexi bacterium]|nr:hypothetical protein [Chloroflexota bacterium]
MRRYLWQVVLGASLVAVSAVVYALHFVIFRDAAHLVDYFLIDLGFMPLEVLFVTLIISGLLTQREKRATMRKLNMVIGAFFSEVGTEMLRLLSSFDLDVGKTCSDLAVGGRWDENQFSKSAQTVRSCDFRLDSRAGDIVYLRDFLLQRREFLLRLLENPNLLEHTRFTDLLWAVLHLAEELKARANLLNLPQADYAHISADMERAYVQLLASWLAYMDHLRVDYPYLFSLAVRTNPFDPNASPEFK